MPIVINLAFDPKGNTNGCEAQGLCKNGCYSFGSPLHAIRKEGSPMKGALCGKFVAWVSHCGASCSAGTLIELPKWQHDRNPKWQRQRRPHPSVGLLLTESVSPFIWAAFLLISQITPNPPTRRPRPTHARPRTPCLGCGHCGRVVFEYTALEVT